MATTDVQPAGHSPEVAQALAALQRAAQKASLLAQQTGTVLVQNPPVKVKPSTSPQAPGPH